MSSGMESSRCKCMPTATRRVMEATIDVESRLQRLYVQTIPADISWHTSMQAAEVGIRQLIPWEGAFPTPLQR